MAKTTKYTLAALRRSEWVNTVGAAEPESYHLSSALGSGADLTADSDPEVSAVLGLLSQVTSMTIQPDDWANPYGPMISIQGQRTMIPDDLNDEQIAFLRASLDEIDHPLLGSRIADTAFLRATGKDRVELAKTALALWIRHQHSDDDWFKFRDEWERFTTVATRLGKPTSSERAEIEDRLLSIFRSTTSGSVAASVASLLRRRGLAETSTLDIAESLDSRALLEKDNPLLARVIHEEAANWFQRAGDSERAALQVFRQVESFLAEADLRGAGKGGSAMIESSLLENALQTLRRISRAQRARLGAQDLAQELQRRIRESGLASLSEMKQFTSEPIDLTDSARQAVERVQDKDPVTALRNFSTLLPFAPYAKDIETAEKLVREYPLQTLVSRVTYSADGRIVNKSGDPNSLNEYGVAEAVWSQLVQAYVFRVGVSTQGVIWPAFVQITNEHRLSVEDFATIVSGSAIVPPDRIGLYARGLYAGFNGDFAAAVHLLVPQIENIVRHHLREAGVHTSNVGKDGAENERGLSALMELSEAVEIFGEDLAYEFRALLCGPLGPNLRNEIAHGLFADSQAVSATTIYTWWFCLKLVFVSYWNRLRTGDTTVNEEEPPSPQNDSKA